MRRLWTVTFTVIVLLLWRAVRADSEQCPDSTVNPSCHCHKLEKDLQLDCPAATAQTLRMILEVINTPIQSLTVHEPDKAMVTSISCTLLNTNKNRFSFITDKAPKEHISRLNRYTLYRYIPVEYRGNSR